MTKPPPKTPKPPSIKSIAEALHVTPRRIGQLRAAGMPCHSIEAALAWRKREDVGNDDCSPERLRRARIRLLDLQAARQQIQNDFESGKLILITDVERDVIETTAALRRMMLDLLGHLPPCLCGLPNEIAIFKVLKEHLYRCMEYMHQGKYLNEEAHEIIETMNPNRQKP